MRASTFSETLMTSELAVAERLYGFFTTAGHLAEAGVVGREDATRSSRRSSRTSSGS
jgi:hypothetical protein